MITSVKNPRVMAAIALRDRRARDEAGLTLVDGVRELGRAMDGEVRVAEVFVDVEGITPDGAAVVERARVAGAVLTGASRPVVDRLAYGDRSEGLVATVHIPSTDLEALRLPAVPLVVVLEGVEKPGNLGAVLRSVDGAGADAVLLADPRTDPFNPNAIRASVGTVFARPVVSGTTDAVLARLRSEGVRVIAARVDGSVPYTEVDLRGAVALVLGSEADGLTDAWTADDITPVHLPMLGVADSLNVSITAAVLLYEARRQRR